MFSSARSIARRVPVVARQVRKMSGHGTPEEMQKEVDKWFKLSVVMTGVTGFFAVINIMFHSHDHPRDDLPYLRIRNKPFPWRECPDCELFNGACWDKCRGKEVAEEHH